MSLEELVLFQLLLSGTCVCSYVFQIIAEGANGPTTIEADQIFLERNVLVIPVSCFFYNESVQKHSRYYCLSPLDGICTVSVWLQ